MNIPRTLPGRLAAALTLLALAGCHAVPIYTPGPTDVRVTMLGRATPTMCVNSTPYRLEPVVTGNMPYFMVPTGQRVKLEGAMSFGSTSSTATCAPAISFTPAAGKSYVMNAGLTEHKCFIELVAVDTSTATGLAPEPTVGAPTC